jgi:hypothetical protein
MRWTKALSLLLCVSVLAAPAPVSTGLIMAASDPVADYAAREAQAGDLEQFVGGWHGFVLTVLLVGLVVWFVYEFRICDCTHDSPPPQAPQTPRP